MSKNVKDDAPALDIDAWIDGAERPEADVTLAAKGKSLAALRSLEDQRGRDLRKRRAESGRMVNVTEHELDAEVAELKAEVRASERTFRIRGIDGDTHQALVEKHRNDKDSGKKLSEAITAAATVDPVMTPEQVHKLRQAVGEGQFSMLWGAVTSTSFEQPDLDF